MPEDPGHLKGRGESSVKAAPVSRSITVPRRAAGESHAAAGRGHVRKTRTVICTLTEGLLKQCPYDGNEDRLRPRFDD